MGRFLMNKNDVIAKCKKKVGLSKKGLGNQYNNTESAQSFYNGDMMTYEDKIQFIDGDGDQKRANVKFNKTQEPVDAVVGFMTQNRRQAKYNARVNTSEEQSLYSRNMNALNSYHRDNMNSDQVETEQDFDMMINGYGATETDLSYIVGNSTTNPNGEILDMHLDPKTVGWDPKAKSKNLLDSRWAYYYQDYDLRDALDLFDKSKEDDFESVNAISDDDSGYTYNPFGGVYDRIKEDDSVEWSSKEENLVRVYNIQWFEYEKFYRAKNPLFEVEDPADAMFIKSRLDIIKSEVKTYTPSGIDAGSMFDFDPFAEEFTFDESTKNKLVEEFGELIEPIGFTRKCFYTAIYSGDHVFSWFKSVCQQGFSIKFKTGSYSEQFKIWVGMINSMMEPQKYYNKAITEFMFTIASLSKGGVMIEENAVEDVAEFEDKYAKTDSVMIVSAGAISGNKILPKQQAILPTGIDTIIGLSDAAITSNGVDPTFLGNANTQESGILQKRRIRQVIAKFAKYFDSITLYQKEHARLMADLIRIWIQNNAGEWIRVTGEDGAEEFKQISEDMLAPEYDVSIQEAAQTPEDKMETAQVIGAYGDKLIMTNPPAAQTFYAESLNLLPIDGDIRNRLTEALQPSDDSVPLAQYQQLEQQLQALQSEVNKANVRKVNADASLNEAKAETESVNQVDTLENTRNKALENDLILTGQYDKASVNI